MREWAHVLFNSKKIYKTSNFVYICPCSLEAKFSLTINVKRRLWIQPFQGWDPGPNPGRGIFYFIRVLTKTKIILKKYEKVEPDTK